MGTSCRTRTSCPISSVGPSISSVTIDIEDFDIECWPRPPGRRHPRITTVWHTVTPRLQVGSCVGRRGRLGVMMTDELQVKLNFNFFFKLCPHDCTPGGPAAHRRDPRSNQRESLPSQPGTGRKRNDASLTIKADSVTGRRSQRKTVTHPIRQS